MSHMNLYGIRAAFHGASCCLCIAFYQFIYLSGRHFFRRVSSYRRWDGCCRLDWRACILCISFRPCVLQLDRDFSALCMTGIRNLLQACDAAVIVQARLSRASLGSFMYNGRLDGNQAKLAFRTFRIICDRLVAPASVRICEVIAHRRNYETVLYSHWSNLDWLEHIFKFHIISSLSNYCLSQELSFMYSVCFRLPKSPAMLPSILSRYCHKYALQLLSGLLTGSRQR